MDLTNLEVKYFKALAHPIRLKIIKKLLDEDMCVCEMKEDLDFSQSNLSQHLKVLKDAGIVNDEREGMRINYNIKDQQISEVLAMIENMIIKDLRLLIK